MKLVTYTPLYKKFMNFLQNIKGHTDNGGEGLLPSGYTYDFDHIE